MEDSHESVLSSVPSTIVSQVPQILAEDALATTVSSTGNAPILRTLPAELLVAIISFVRTPADLDALARTCRSLFPISQSFLYQTLRFMSLGGESQIRYRRERAGEPAAQQDQDDLETRFFRGLPESGLGRLIFSLHVTLGQTRNCTGNFEMMVNHSPTDPTLETTYQPLLGSDEFVEDGQNVLHFVWKCTCDDYDGILRDALKEMPLLDSLQLICELCATEQFPTHRHNYLLDSTGEVAHPLKNFAFQCKCSVRAGQYVSDLLVSPILSGVSSLLLDLMMHTEEMDADGRKVLESTLQEDAPEKRVLSKLKTLGQNGTWYSTMIMAHRAVERAGLVTFNGEWPGREEIHNCLCNGPGAKEGTLNTFYADNILDWSGLIKLNPSPYRNVVEVGTFTFTAEPNDAVFAQVSFLALFKRLHMVHLNRKYLNESAFEAIDISPQLVTKLGLINSGLRYIRVCNRPWSPGDPASVLWERCRIGPGTSEEWKACELRSPVHTYWDVIKGREEF